MKKLYSIGVLCALVFFCARQTPGQSTPASPTPTDPAITPLSVMGVVTSFTTETRQVIVTTNAGNQVTVTLSDATEFMRIPPGETRSYAQLAAQLGQPEAARAVASACAHNRVAIVVPCHRVIRGDGSLGGYRWGLPLKQRLLDRERAA